MNATEACIALNMLPTVGPVRLRKLLEVFQEPQQILAAKRGDLRKVEGIGNRSPIKSQIGNRRLIFPLSLSGSAILARLFSHSNRPRIPRRYARSMRRRLCSTSGADSKTAIITLSALSARDAPPITGRNRLKSSPTNLLTRGSP